MIRPQLHPFFRQPGEAQRVVGRLPTILGRPERLPAVIGHARALDLVLNARINAAGEAHSIGLVHRLAPRGEARAAAVPWAGELAKRSPAFRHR